MKDKNNKFDQISKIFSQFSEGNKDRLLETAKGLLKTQKESVVTSTACQSEVKFQNCGAEHCAK